MIQSFYNHGCGLGLDIKAQPALRRLLGALEQAEEAIFECEAMVSKLLAEFARTNRGGEA